MIGKVLACIALTVTAAAVQATVVDFQDVTSGDCHYHGSSVISRGFSFAPNDSLFVCNANVIQHNTTAALIDANARSIITMTQVGGGTFSLQSFFAGGRTQDYDPDAAVTAYTVATGIEIVGNLFGGGTVSTTIALDDTAPYDWDQFTLTGFTNLTSVVFTAQGTVGGNSNPEFLIDDIVVNAAVPEPASLALAASGLVWLALRRRKGRATRG